MSISSVERSRMANVIRQIKNRCDNPNNHRYPAYGGRGLGYDKDLMTVDGMLAEIGPRPSPLHSIDRIDNNVGYYKRNLRWATAKEQARNRRDNVLITVDGETLCASDWANRWNIDRRKLYKGLAPLPGP